MLSHSVVSDSAALWTAAYPGSSAQGVLQARILEWDANSGYKENFKRTNSRETS